MRLNSGISSTSSKVMPSWTILDENEGRCAIKQWSSGASVWSMERRCPNPPNSIESPALVFFTGCPQQQAQRRVRGDFAWFLKRRTAGTNGVDHVVFGRMAGPTLAQEL